jgi:hypothetical protein
MTPLDIRLLTGIAAGNGTMRNQQCIPNPCISQLDFCIEAGGGGA